MKCLSASIAYDRMAGRPPHGGRGLKYQLAEPVRDTVRSPPTRGAWIEILNWGRDPTMPSVAPHTGGVD